MSVNSREDYLTELSQSATLTQADPPVAQSSDRSTGLDNKISTHTQPISSIQNIETPTLHSNHQGTTDLDYKKNPQSDSTSINPIQNKEPSRPIHRRTVALDNKIISQLDSLRNSTQSLETSRPRFSHRRTEPLIGSNDSTQKFHSLKKQINGVKEIESEPLKDTISFTKS